MPYGLMYQGPPEDDEQTAAFQQAQELMRMLGIDSSALEMEPPGAAPTPPPRVGAGRDIMGSLGDALLSQASVRAGGGPVAMGPFAAGQRQTERDYQERLMEFQKRQTENEAANRSLRNSLRMLGMKRGPVTDPLDRERLEETKRHNLATEGRLEGRQRTRLVYDRAGNAYEQDLDTKEVNPIKLGGGEQAGRPFTAGEVEAGAVSSVIEGQLSDFETGADAYSKKRRTLGSPRAIGQKLVRSVPGVGQELSESFGDPDFESLSALRDRIGQQLARLVDSGRLSDQDREFALQTLPTVASLNTEQGRLTFRAKIAQARNEIKRRMAARERLRPGLSTPTRREMAEPGEGEYLEPEDLEDEPVPDDKKAALNAIRRKHGLPEIP